MQKVRNNHCLLSSLKVFHYANSKPLFTLYYTLRYSTVYVSDHASFTVYFHAS